jgi:hypothetical protein
LVRGFLDVWSRIVDISATIASAVLILTLALVARKALG